MVPKTRELLPEPETPVKTVRRRLGSSTLTSLRLFSRAPLTRMTSWRSAGCRRSEAGFVDMGGSEQGWGGAGNRCIHVWMGARITEGREGADRRTARAHAAPGELRRPAQTHEGRHCKRCVWRD